MRPSSAIIGLVALATCVIIGAGVGKAMNPAQSQRATCGVIKFKGQGYVFSKYRIGCSRAKRYAHHVGRTRGNWEPPGWHCSSGSDFKAGGFCKRRNHWLSWYPGD